MGMHLIRVVLFGIFRHICKHAQSSFQGSISFCLTEINMLPNPVKINSKTSRLWCAAFLSAHKSHFPVVQLLGMRRLPKKAVSVRLNLFPQLFLWNEQHGSSRYSGTTSKEHFFFFQDRKKDKVSFRHHSQRELLPAGPNPVIRKSGE